MPTVYSSILYDDVRIYDSLKIAQGGGLFKTYTEEGLHRPFASSFYGSRSDGSQLFTFQNVAPHIGEETSVLRLPFTVIVDDTLGNASGRTLMDKLERMRFIDISYTDSNGNAAAMYGWVDGYRITGSGGPQSTVEIRWHLDYYLSYPNTGYGAGRILRGPASYARPDPSEPRRWVYSDKTVLSNTWAAGGDKFVLLIYQKTENSNTSVEYLDWKIGETITSGGVSYSTLNISQLYQGLLEEKLGIDPDTIIGCWISPFDMAGTSTQILTHGTYAAHVVGLTTATYINNVTAVTPGDNDLYIVTDQNGQRVGEVGWGCTFDKITVTTDAGAEGCRIRIVFEDTSKADWIGEGRVVEIPAIPVPVTSNAWSSYVYSGQREYDKTTARINQEKQLVNSVAGIGTSAIGGAVAGSMVAPGAGTVAGAVAGIVSGTVGAGVSYFSSGHYDRKAQEATDRLMANQSGNIVLGGGGPNWLRDDWYLVHLVRDSVSAAEMSDEQSELGYRTDSYSADCTTLISGGGGLKIEGLEVKDVGPAGQRYISSLFARGVHLD